VDASPLLCPALQQFLRRRCGGCFVRYACVGPFCGHRPDSERVPDATTLKNFRHLLEDNQLAQKILAHINALLADKGLMLREGTIVNATLIAAPPSTKNKDKICDPEMHQAKKGNQWDFGMKRYIGVDAASGLTHTAVGTAAHDSDVVMASNLLHGYERRVYADAGYTGVAKWLENEDKILDWNVARKRGQFNKLARRRREVTHLLHRKTQSQRQGQG
jgi:IS5 family transposase